MRGEYVLDKSFYSNHLDIYNTLFITHFQNRQLSYIIHCPLAVFPHLQHPLTA